MATRLPPPAMAKKLGRVLRSQHADIHDIEKVFHYTSHPPIGGSERQVCFLFSCPPLTNVFKQPS